MNRSIAQPAGALCLLAILSIGCGIFDLTSNQPMPGTVPQHEPSDTNGKPTEPSTPDKTNEPSTDRTTPANTPSTNKGNVRVTSFSSAKKQLMQIHEKHPRTFYCNCRFDQGKRIALRTCGYKVRKNKERAQRVEFEHVVPASRFGHGFKSWIKGDSRCTRSDGRPYKGRRCAEKVSKLYKLMQADMHNLQPAIGEVNGDRSNYPMAMLPGEPRIYGTCDVEIKDRKIEPRVSVRGDIARSYLYMAKAYPDVEIMTAKERQMFLVWSKLDPPDEWERTRNQLIGKIQGNLNPYIK